MTKEEIEALQNAGNKLRQMWGGNPDSDIIDKAVAHLTATAEAPAEEAKTTTRAKKA